MKVPATKSDDESSIPWTHMVEGIDSHKLSPDLPRCAMAHPPLTHTLKNNKSLKALKKLTLKAGHGGTHL